MSISCAILAVFIIVHIICLFYKQRQLVVAYNEGSGKFILNSNFDIYPGITAGLLWLPVNAETCARKKELRSLPDFRFSLDSSFKNDEFKTGIWEFSGETPSKLLHSKIEQNLSKNSVHKLNIHDACSCTNSGKKIILECPISTIYYDKSTTFSVSSKINLSNGWELQGTPTLQFWSMEHGSLLWWKFCVRIALALCLGLISIGCRIYLHTIHKRNGVA